MGSRDRQLPPGERRFQRATCEFPARFSWGTINNHALVMVISIGGCFMSTEAMVPEGEEIDLSFGIGNDKKSVHCHGKVAWVAKRGIKVRGVGSHRGFAVEFMRIYPEERALIDEYVRKQTRLFRGIEHELKKKRPDKGIIKDLFRQARPHESTHLNHIKKACREELRYFRLRK